MRRREFIILFGGAAAAWPLAARAQQQPQMPVVGFMGGGSRASLHDALLAFEAGLKEMGFIEGQNLALEYHFADGQYERFPAFAADLVQRRVSVIAVSTPPGAFAAKRATTAIPIVFSVGTDPVQIGLVPSLSRPGRPIVFLRGSRGGCHAETNGCGHDDAYVVPERAKRHLVPSAQRRKRQTN
jgi:putative tryptophan/tyrosine transport system substrate-binding protein